jgi:AraC-like DNA-binding protein
MIAAFVVYLSHFFFYSGLENIYIAIDPIYQLSSLLVYPLYHIYFRLLTIDQTFSIRKHWHLLLAPFMCFILYLIGVIVADNNEYKMWLFNRNLNFTSSAMLYLKTIDQLIRVCFIIQVVYVVVSNFRLITKYGHKASHFYSNATDSSTIRITLLNYSMIFTAISSITLATLGRDFFKNEYTGIIIAAVIFSSMLFLIGWLGDRQKVLNPAFESDEISDNNEHNENSTDNQNMFVEKIQNLFATRQLFLNSKLNILDVASELGSNRTYISYMINKSFNQNFCSYVNQYRIQFLEEKLKEHPELPNQQLAELCGFGSVDSMKRAVLTKTGISLQEWKSKLNKPGSKNI